MQLYLLLAFLLSSTLQFFAQDFRIPGEKYPFNNVIDWKGNGALLMNSDPKGVTKQVFLTFIGNEPRSLWQETIVPKSENPSIVMSDESRYIYFLDNVALDNGKFSFYQLNNAGNVKTTSCSHTVALKKLGFDVNELTLIDVVVTDKALVHLFRSTDKKEKTESLIATFMTHHNFQSYAAVIGVSGMDEIKQGLQDEWNYAGFSGDKIGFYRYVQREKKQGIDWAIYSSKGEKGDARFIESTVKPALTWKTTSIAYTGASYLKTNESNKRVQVVYTNDEVRLLSLSSNECAVQIAEGSLFKPQQNFALQANSKKGIELGYYAMIEGLIFENGGELFFLNYAKKSALTKLEKSAFFNPSHALTEGKGKMTFDAGSVWLTFDASQLNKTGEVVFGSHKK